MKTDKKTDKLDDETLEHLANYFVPLEEGTEELDDVDVLEDLIEEDD